MEVAREEGRNEAACQIPCLMQRERSRLLWRRLKGAMAVQRGQSVQSVQVTDAEGVSREFTDQSGIEEAIWENIHHKRFYLAEEAPI